MPFVKVLGNKSRWHDKVVPTLQDYSALQLIIFFASAESFRYWSLPSDSERKPYEPVRDRVAEITPNSEGSKTCFRNKAVYIDVASTERGCDEYGRSSEKKSPD